jgi:hypothetical protein
MTIVPFLRSLACTVAFLLFVRLFRPTFHLLAPPLVLLLAAA